MLVNGADQVTINGFKAQQLQRQRVLRRQRRRLHADHLIAANTGVYGIYAFNSKGGMMRDSEAYYNNDAGFYIGQTPAQAKPMRSIVNEHRVLGQPARLLAARTCAT